MLSIHTASTGPSNTIQNRWPVVSSQHERKMTARIPSVHSCDTASNSP